MSWLQSRSHGIDVNSSPTWSARLAQLLPLWSNFSCVTVADSDKDSLKGRLFRQTCVDLTGRDLKLGWQAILQWLATLLSCSQPPQECLHNSTLTLNNPLGLHMENYLYTVASCRYPQHHGYVLCYSMHTEANSLFLLVPAVPAFWIIIIISFHYHLTDFHY